MTRVRGATLGGVAAAVAAAGMSARARRRRTLRRIVQSRALPASWERVHREKVERLSRRLRASPTGAPLSVRKSGVSHQVPKARDRRHADQKIDIRELDAILVVDPVRKICIAEPGVRFVDLVAATLDHGLVPLVVPELKGITIGGAVSGCSIESSSFRYGGFHDTCVEYEVLTSTGRVLTCTPENEHRLVFQMMHGSFGTLGVLTRLTFRLMPAKPFVRVTYEKHRRLEDYLRSIDRHFQSLDVDFMDGIVHSPDEWVLCLGHFAGEAPYTNRYDWMKIYWRSTSSRTEDFLTTPEYFFRYDRGVTGRLPRSAVIRFLFGKFLGSTVVLRAARLLRFLLKNEQPTVTLDVFLPFSKIERYLEWYRRELGYFPLWVVPYRRVRDYEWIAPRILEGLEDRLFVDLAVYGMKQRRDQNLHRLIELELLRLGGLKTLISHNYYSEAEFWSTWNRENYDAAKAVMDPGNRFRDLYEKTCRAAMGLP